MFLGNTVQLTVNPTHFLIRSFQSAFAWKSVLRIVGKLLFTAVQNAVFNSVSHYCFKGCQNLLHATNRDFDTPIQTPAFFSPEW
jgi:hypothetical protein